MNENNDNDFKILNFDDGTIFIEDIINKCFKEEDNLYIIDDDFDTKVYSKLNKKISRKNNKF